MAMLIMLDNITGRVMKALDTVSETDREKRMIELLLTCFLIAQAKVLDNTIVIFTSDNGAHVSDTDYLFGKPFDHYIHNFSARAHTRVLVRTTLCAAARGRCTRAV